MERGGEYKQRVVTNNMQFQKLSILPHGRFFVLHPPPKRNSSLVSCFASKILAFKNPLPRIISDDLPGGGFHVFCFLELPNAP